MKDKRMTDVTTFIWPPAEATGGTFPEEITALLSGIADAAGITLTPATPEQATGEAPVEGPCLVLYHTFLRGAMLAYDGAVATGYEDSADGFKRFTSEYLSNFVAFRRRWIAPKSEAIIQLQLTGLQKDGADTLIPVLEQLSPKTFARSAPKAKTLKQITATVAALLDRLHPNNFRYNDNALLQTLRGLKLPREVVSDTFEQVMQRPAPASEMLFFQAMPSVNHLKAALRASSEYINRFGLDEDTITASYRLFINRDPSPAELKKMQATHPDLESLRKVFLKSDEFAKQYARFSRQGSPGERQPVDAPVPFKSPPRLNRADTPRVVFLHIPKCGGTTLHNMLCHWFHSENVHPERFNGLYGYTAASLASSTVFSGHYDHYATSLIPGPKKMISFLRDPMDRLVSLYNFHRAHSPEVIQRNNLQLPRWANEHDIDAYFAHDTIRSHPAINNSIVRYFSDVPQVAFSKPADQSTAPTLDDMLDQAMHNIEKFAFIGFMDQYAADMDRLAQTLECDPPEKLRKAQVLDELMQTNPDMRKITKQKPSAASLNDMEDLVAYDRLLYAHARSLIS